ncbi:MAG: AAA family ATPase [Paludibacteraceae bacterium]|nr:AAA family ATPase [Paludibacteraceae bacterium]
MLESYLASQIRAEIPFEPTSEQIGLTEQIGRFLAYSGGDSPVFLLRGYAGTGKTTVVAALVRALAKLKQEVVMLAPTGRAAKVLSSYAGTEAYTIHHAIYRQKSPENNGQFELGFNRHAHALFVVDEASMLADGGTESFGSGNLLLDLLDYVYSRGDCRLLLLGDRAQLPPVRCEHSPALDAATFRRLGFEVFEYDLTQVVRQSAGSGILTEATRLRCLLDNRGRLHLQTHPDVQRLSGAEFVESLEQSYREVGEEDTLVLTRSNKMAQYYAQGIRARVLGREEMLSNSDLVMVVKNNYLVGAQYGLDFIANGDTAQVLRMRGSRELYGFRFTDAVLRLTDYDREIEARVLLDSLTAETPADLAQMTDRLYQAVLEDYADIRNKRERYQKMRLDPWLNALQLKSAYAVTCHKAQGGQWAHVYVDMGRVSVDETDDNLLRWLYTAFTRATRRLYLVNFPNSCF